MISHKTPIIRTGSENAGGVHVLFNLLAAMALPRHFLPSESVPDRNRNPDPHFMRVIAVGRFIYGLILLALGLTIFNLMGKNLAPDLLKLVQRLHIDSHLYYIHWLMQKISSVDHALLVLITIMNFFYALLAFVEALGLLFEKRWAYWLVIVDTASFIPVETWQLCKHFGWVNLILLLYYFTTVVYLLFQLKRLPRPDAKRTVMILSPEVTQA
jgi:uncharacterized membrane protein (DUF2068 family)